jgi:3',5'-cyclic-nucleotide phosphodiesterase
MNVEGHPLAHGAHSDSTAFLIDADGAFVLYMGDTGPDEIEGRPTTRRVWEQVAPLVREGRLHAVSMECSFGDECADDQLYSHLKPRWVIHAFRQLAETVDPADPRHALEGLNVIITHVKPHLGDGEPTLERVRRQLDEQNDLGLRLIFAEQGRELEL